MVHATLINAPTSTKNRDKARDPEMHQTKKRNQWYHGMKAHVGVEAESGLVHSTHYTAANDHPRGRGTQRYTGFIVIS
jgi:IS5 family transposase